MVWDVRGSETARILDSLRGRGRDGVKWVAKEKLLLLSLVFKSEHHLNESTDFGSDFAGF